MGRPQEFDEHEALGAAVRCFWNRGFEATHVRDLAKTMGISAASLYNTFGGKHALFRRALDHYLDRRLRAKLHGFETTLPPRAAIGAFLDHVVERCVADPQRRGCMLVNSAIEMAPHDAGVRDVVGDELALVEQFYRRCVAAGQEAGTITASRSADDLARLLLAAQLGIVVLARTWAEPAALRGVADVALSVLDDPVNMRTEEKRKNDQSVLLADSERS